MDELQAEPTQGRRDFRGELAVLLNSFSMENGSNTPDFLLADFLADSLAVYAGIVNRRSALQAPDVMPSEALFGFVAWLTTRDEAVSFGAAHDAGVCCDLISEYCKVNNLEKPRDGVYPNNLKMPKDGNPL